jgi:hypothetical protein
MVNFTLCPLQFTRVLAIVANAVRQRKKCRFPPRSLETASRCAPVSLSPFFLSLTRWRIRSLSQYKFSYQILSSNNGVWWWCTSWDQESIDPSRGDSAPVEEDAVSAAVSAASAYPRRRRRKILHTGVASKFSAKRVHSNSLIFLSSLKTHKPMIIDLVITLRF